MVTILFEAHGTTTDNEQGLASGLRDVALSSLGEEQAKQLSDRYADQLPSAVFCSDLQRSWRTAEIAFAAHNAPIIRDRRLRECDYGELTGKPNELVDTEKGNHISAPFPGGQSYAETTELMKEFLGELEKRYDGKTVVVIGHRATQYALEHLINGEELHKVVTAPWTWQPGWVYSLSVPTAN